MIKALYAMLGVNMWRSAVTTLDFEDAAWGKLVEKAHEAGINMIVLDVGEGIEWKSHPQLAVKNAWSYYRVKQEIVHLRDMGITLIPKLNFSATHHLWLGEYRKMMSTKVYYDVCRDLIHEVYDLFEKPEYIHLGMDEEGNANLLQNYEGLLNFRRGELLWHDLKYLCDTVTALGAKPWIWGDICGEFPEEFQKRFALDSVLLSPWYYFSFNPEHFKKISDGRPSEIAFYRDTFPYNQMGLTYIEEDPGYVKMRSELEASASLGYGMVPCFSDWGGSPYNAPEMIEFYTQRAKSGSLLGFMIAPWCRTKTECLEELFRNLDTMKKYTGDM
ncbi:MAG: hypothetical protein IJC35_05765 [Oscillospiraceae bacterium]|nr:hypothetical protein [Oscillospiraceae bacterium]